MTPTNPLPAEAPHESPIDKTELLTAKINRAMAQASKNITSDLDQFEQTNADAHEVERLETIANHLFESADTLIYLAEAVQQKRARMLGRVAATETVEVAPSINDAGYDRYEQFLLDLFAAHTTLSHAEIIQHGFAGDVDDLARRKALLKRTLGSLTQKLSTTETPLVGTGNTRARKYSLGSAALIHDAGIEDDSAQPEYTAFAEPEVVAEAVEPAEEYIEVQPLPTIDVFAHLRNPIEEKRIAFENSVYQAVSDIIDASSRPVFHIQSIVRRSPESALPADVVLNRIAKILHDDDRVHGIGRGEYAITGRDTDEPWIDEAELAMLASDAIDDLVTSGVSSRAYHELINGIVAAGHEPFVSAERDVLISLFKNDSRAETAGPQHRFMLKRTGKKRRSLAKYRSDLDAKIIGAGLKGGSIVGFHRNK